MKNIDKIKHLNAVDLAYMVCIDNDGECRSCCSICQRLKENNCDDRCVQGVFEWFESEE